MTSHVIKMPDIGEGIAEVEIVEWHVAVGDKVAEDQVLADVMTDKASVEIPSPIAGTVQALGGQVGDVLAVGAELIVLQPLSVSVDADLSDAATPITVTETSKQEITPTEPKQEPSMAVQAVTAAPGTQKILASPSVRQRARHLDIDLQNFADLAAGSHVTHRDLDNYLLSRSSSPQTVNASASAPVSAPVAGPDYTIRSDIDIPVVGLRRSIARKMQEAKRHIPHFSYVEEIDVTDLERLRQTLNEQQDQQSERLTLLPFIVRALVVAVRQHPEINARYDDENEIVTQSGAVHLGIATQTETGLMVPVMRHAENLDLWHCASEIRRLADAARNGRARRDELFGSTLTLTSLGALGGVVSTPIINYPEVAIIGVNRIIKKPVIYDGAVVTRKMMNLSSSFDHRVVDGMNAAQFIQEVKRLLECPALLFMTNTL